MNDNEYTLFNSEEIQSPFDAIKEMDENGREWWNSRRLARLMGYMKYWNFERLMDKVAAFLSGEVQLSAPIRKNLTPSDNCDEHGILLCI